jgi:hypothetical protein
MWTPSANSVNEISYSWYAPPDEDELDEDADELLELLLAVVPRVILLLMRSKIDMATRVVRCSCANALHFHCFVRLVLALPITSKRRGEDQAPGRVKQAGAGGQKSSNFLNFLSELPHFPRPTTAP